MPILNEAKLVFTIVGRKLRRSIDSLAEIAGARLCPSTMMITTKILISSHTATGPSKALGPVIEEIFQISIILLLKLLLVVLSFLDSDSTPSQIHAKLVIVKVPGDEFELSFMNATVLACTIAVIPLSSLLALRLVRWPIVTLTGFVLSRTLCYQKLRANGGVVRLTQYKGPLHLPHRLRSFQELFLFLQ